jgi:hypothetical protein
MQRLIDSTDVLLNKWKSKREHIAKNQKEIAENTQCIRTLELNLNKQECLDVVRTIVDEKNAVLEKDIREFEIVNSEMLKAKQKIKEMMEALLDMYKKIHLTMDAEKCDGKLGQDAYAVEIAKISYSNLLDNHNWRCEPGIANIFKDDYRGSSSNMFI